ncbi:hypothetical protein, partial [Leuconostoc lactis]
GGSQRKAGLDWLVALEHVLCHRDFHDRTDEYTWLYQWL